MYIYMYMSPWRLLAAHAASHIAPVGSAISTYVSIYTYLHLDLDLYLY